MFTIMFFEEKNPFDKSIKIYLDNVIINRKETTPFLGVCINESLSWKEHIATVVKKLSVFVYIM